MVNLKNICYSYLKWCMRSDSLVRHLFIINTCSLCEVIERNEWNIISFNCCCSLRMHLMNADKVTVLSGERIKRKKMSFTFVWDREEWMFQEVDESKWIKWKFLVPVLTERWSGNKHCIHFDEWFTYIYKYTHRMEKKLVMMMMITRRKRFNSIKYQLHL